jgi:hypothetical protein
MKRIAIGSIALAGALLTVGLALGHHSISAEFDVNSPISFTGTVKAVDWLNPHIYTHVEVEGADGAVTTYKVEGGPPNALFRRGWRKESLKPGEVVTVEGIRAKSAESMNIGSARITTQDGLTPFSGSANE